MMRVNYPKGTIITWSVWSGAFVVLSLFMAWRMDWFAGGGDSPVEETAATEPEENNEQYLKLAKSDDPTNPAVFQRQVEPVDSLDDFSKPLQLPPSNSAQQIPPPPVTGTSSGTQPGFLTGTNKKSDVYLAVGTNNAKTNTEILFPRKSRIRTAEYRKTQTDDSVPPAQVLGEIDRMIRQRDYVEAHRKLSTIYWNKPKWRSAIKTRLEMNAETIYFKPRPHLLRPYVVKYGDSLPLIAKKYGVTWRYLAALNELRVVKTKSGREIVNIRPGDQLKVMKGVAKGRRLFRVFVDLSERVLVLHHDGMFVRKFRVGIGRENRSPTGTFSVKDKVLDPPYDGKDARTFRRVHYDGKDPRNPLGSHWISIGGSFGIHGTIDPKSIGKAASQGCIRMHNADVKEVYQFLLVGSEVIIRP